MFNFVFSNHSMSVTEKADKKEQIIKAAEQLFAEKGFDGTSVRDVSQAANVNLAMISYYFGSKEKMLQSMIEQRLTHTLGVLESIGKEPIDSWEKIQKLMDFLVDKIIGNHRFHCIINQEYNTDRSREIKELITNIKMRNFEQIKKIILEGQRKNVFRKVDIEMTMASVMGTITQVVNSRNLYCKLLNTDPNDDEAYRKKMSAKLKTHLRQLMESHLLEK